MTDQTGRDYIQEFLATYAGITSKEEAWSEITSTDSTYEHDGSVRGWRNADGDSPYTRCRG